MKHIVGHIILAHANLDRVNQLADYLTDNDCPVVIHIDKKTSDTAFNMLHSNLEKNTLVHFVNRTNAEWGGMSLVTATLDCARAMLKHFPNVGHVFLNSGSCLPIKPATELAEFLSRHQGTDFIESVSIESEDWVQDGLSSERFKFYFPFSWKHQRYLFDAATWVQRKLNVNRRRPDNFVPHLGSQWWCLTNRTLTELLNDPRRRAYERYFHRSWIPDESFFQTLVRNHSERMESRSLTWSKFDGQGKPFLLYDDHVSLLGQSDCFMARKAWPKANLLYQTMLGETAPIQGDQSSGESELDRLFENARKSKQPTPTGKVNPGRFPTGSYAKRDKTARKYTVLMGARELYPDLQTWLNVNENVLCHGNLFAQEGVEFADGTAPFDGNISANRLIRNYRAPAFLANVIWNKRDIAQTFFFDLGDNQKAHDPIFKDPNAHVIMIEEAWILHFLALQKTGADTRSKAKLLYASEQRLNRVIARASTEAKITRFTIKDVIHNPQSYLQTIQESASQSITPLVSALAQDIDLVKLNEVIQHLRNEGFKLEIQPIPNPASPQIKTAKPRLVEQ